MVWTNLSLLKMKVIRFQRGLTVDISSFLFLGRVFLPGDPTSDNEAANKRYVDTVATNLQNSLTTTINNLSTNLNNTITQVETDINNRINLLSSNVTTFSSDIQAAMSNLNNTMADYNTYYTSYTNQTMTNISNIQTNIQNAINNAITDIQNNLNNTGVPVGVIVLSSRTLINPSINRLLPCDGRYVQKSSFQSLFNVIGHTFDEKITLYNVDDYPQPITFTPLLPPTGAGRCENLSNITDVSNLGKITRVSTNILANDARSVSTVILRLRNPVLERPVIIFTKNSMVHMVSLSIDDLGAIGGSQEGSSVFLRYNIGNQSYDVGTVLYDRAVRIQEALLLLGGYRLNNNLELERKPYYIRINLQNTYSSSYSSVPTILELLTNPTVLVPNVSTSGVPIVTSTHLYMIGGGLKAIRARYQFSNSSKVIDVQNQQFETVTTASSNNSPLPNYLDNVDSRFEVIYISKYRVLLVGRLVANEAPYGYLNKVGFYLIDFIDNNATKSVDIHSVTDITTDILPNGMDTDPEICKYFNYVRGFSTRNFIYLFLSRKGNIILKLRKTPTIAALNNPFTNILNNDSASSIFADSTYLTGYDILHLRNYLFIAGGVIHNSNGDLIEYNRDVYKIRSYNSNMAVDSLLSYNLCTFRSNTSNQLGLYQEGVYNNNPNSSTMFRLPIIETVSFIQDYLPEISDISSFFKAYIKY